MRDQKLSPKWYFGGLASAGAAVCTHPLDLIKVHLQTQEHGHIRILPFTLDIIKKQGIFSLYNGLSASILRQLTYSTTRFGVYEICKQFWIQSQVGSNKIHLNQNSISNNDKNYNTLNVKNERIPPLNKDDCKIFEKNMPLYVKLSLAAIAGLCGGVIGSPADMINVRMQNDIKLPLDKRRNYKHALDGLIKVNNQEGFLKLYSGVTMATSRGIFMTIGQLAFYDQVKQYLIQNLKLSDNVHTHIMSSVSASMIAATLTQPLDVLKTRLMNAKPNEYKIKPISIHQIDFLKSGKTSTPLSVIMGPVNGGYYGLHVTTI
ncbi:mitochondrial dicarboxylate carrier-like isoform X1 [Gordionus sp. m RMFG-2023]|uniref:mitochondrial dicarboxylate carrier-like isoform X1 n=1 Tax=Gordionus sp. m RMFG-2023 TaxID=3053472 RepID=UPI0031FCD370